MKLAIIRTIAHHTSGDAKPLIPVQENASFGAATSLAPRFKRSSEANTHTTLRPSCSDGLPKPDGRFCIRFSSARSFRRNKFSISAGRIAPCAPGVRRAEDCPPYHAIAAPSKLIRVRKLLQDWVVARRPEVFEHSTKNRIQEWIRMRDVQIERHQLAIQMQLRLIIERVAVIIFQPLLQRPRDDVAQRVKV